MSIFSLTIIRYLITLLFGCISTAFFAGILSEKERWIRYAYCVLALAAIQSFLFLKIPLTRLMQLYPLHTHAILILMLVVFFHCSVLNATLCTFLAYMCCQVPAWISKFAFFISEDYSVELICYVSVTLLVLWIIRQYIAVPLHKLISSSRSMEWTVLIVPAAYYIFDYSTTMWTQLLYQGNYYATQFIPTMLCIMYFIFMIVYYKEHHQKLKLIQDKTILDNLIRNAEHTIQHVYEQQNMTRIYRHDMRHHFALLQHMLEHSSQAEALQYVQENLSRIEKITPKRFCDTELLNLLLSHYDREAAANQIDCTFDVHPITELPLSNSELCVLISNALENAIYGVKALPEKRRTIHVKLSTFNQKFIFSCDNACDASLKLDNTIPKSGNENHGYGLRSIQLIVQLHDGNSYFQAEEGRFSLMVAIPNRRDVRSET